MHILHIYNDLNLLETHIKILICAVKGVKNV